MASSRWIPWRCATAQVVIVTAKKSPAAMIRSGFTRSLIVARLLARPASRRVARLRLAPGPRPRAFARRRPAPLGASQARLGGDADVESHLLRIGVLLDRRREQDRVR